MDYARVKSYAKINLTLNITGSGGDFHYLDSAVASVDLYDLITVKKRKDDLFSITMHGCGSELIPFEQNNAQKAAQAFQNAYGVGGADITVYKNIPMGLGLGGSSADSAGVLRALAKLYSVNDVAGLKLLADSCGSDTRYMLRGGFARLTGRGDAVTEIESKLKLYILLLAPLDGVSTKDCYELFDSVGKVGGSSDEVVFAIERGEVKKLKGKLCNALYPAARRLNPSVETAFNALAEFDPLAVNMTGSGSGVYAVFENAEFRDYAISRYRGKFKTYPLKTVIPKR